MKFNKWTIGLAAVAILTVGTCASFAYGDGVGQTEIPVVGNADNVATMVTPFLVDLATKHAWLLGILSVIGIFRLVFKPVISIVETVVKQTPSDADDKFLARCESSVWYRWAWFLADWLGSIKPPGSSTTNPVITKQGNS